MNSSSVLGLEVPHVCVWLVEVSLETSIEPLPLPVVLRGNRPPSERASSQQGVSLIYT